MTEKATPGRLDGLLAETVRAERLVLIAFIGVNVLFPLALFVAGLPKPWRPFAGEDAPINWFSSVQCALIGGIAFATFIATRLGHSAGTEPIPRSWPWLVFAAGFAAMSVDEQFTGHELIREEILKPRGILTDVGLLRAGDIVLILYVVVGLALAWFLLPELRRKRASLITFISAIVLIGISAVQDALELAIFDNRDLRHARTILEEVSEIWAQLLFAISFTLLLFLKLRLLLRSSR